MADAYEEMCNMVKVKFVIVSEDSSFKMDQKKLQSNYREFVDAEFVPNNTKPLPALYNEKLAQERQSMQNDCLIFMHGDVSFNMDAFM